jgi:hypothetical protein
MTSPSAIKIIPATILAILPAGVAMKLAMNISILLHDICRGHNSISQTMADAGRAIGPIPRDLQFLFVSCRAYPGEYSVWLSLLFV